MEKGFHRQSRIVSSGNFATRWRVLLQIARRNFSLEARPWARFQIKREGVAGEFLPFIDSINGRVNSFD